MWFQANFQGTMICRTQSASFLLSLRRLLDAQVVELEVHDAVERTFLILAAELGYETVVQMLLDEGAEADYQGG